MMKNHRFIKLGLQKAATPDTLPDGFPEDCWLVGYRSFADRDGLLGAYCQAQMEKRRRQLRQAAGTAGEEKLFREIEQLEQILKEIDEWN